MDFWVALEGNVVRSLLDSLVIVGRLHIGRWPDCVIFLQRHKSISSLEKLDDRSQIVFFFKSEERRGGLMYLSDVIVTPQTFHFHIQKNNPVILIINTLTPMLMVDQQ